MFLQRLKMMTAVIATHNRSAMLKDALESLAEQDTERKFAYEVIVADNNSTDATKNVVEGLVPRFRGRLRYLFEPRQGKSFALNTAIRQSRGEYLIFTDDDVLCDRRWLLGYWVCFEDYGCDAAGGRILTLYPPDAPSWVRKVNDIISGPMVYHDYGKDPRPYDFNRMPPFFGANMAVRRDFFERYGLFRHDLGAGRSATGEDTEVFRRLQVAGKKIFYAGGALLYHRTGKDRLNYRYIAKWTVGSGRSNTRRRTDMRKFTNYLNVPRYLYRETVIDSLRLARSIFDRREFTRRWMKVFFDIGVALEFRRKNILAKKGDPAVVGEKPPRMREEELRKAEAGTTGEHNVR